VDGGASANNLLLQFQADVLGVPVIRPQTTETTALGAAYLAGLAVGLWQSRREIAAQWTAERSFRPAMKTAERARLCGEWARALQRAKAWEAPTGTRRPKGKLG
jgi:glycerol kinase